MSWAWIRTSSTRRSSSTTSPARRRRSSPCARATTAGWRSARRRAAGGCAGWRCCRRWTSRRRWTLSREHRLFVTCQTLEDVPYLMKLGTEDHLMIGSDFSHADQSADIDSLRTIQQWADDGTISQEAARKILEDNPAAFYGV